MAEQFPPDSGPEAVTKLRRIDDMSAADFAIAASQIEGTKEVVKTERGQLKDLWEEIQEEYWFMRPEYRTVEPKEQWSLQIGLDMVSLYNFSEKITLTNELVARIGLNIARFAATFPSLQPQLETVTIVDKPYDDPLEDDMGEASPRARMLMLNSYALEEDIYRPELPVARLDAVVLHELAHFEMDTHLEMYWELAGFYWDEVIYSEKLDQRANMPEACITNYAVRGGIYEDIAESAVAYLLSGAKLDPIKKELLGRYDNWRRIPQISYKKEDTIVLPELPKELTYYVDQDEYDGE